MSPAESIPSLIRVRLRCEGLPADRFAGWDGRQDVLSTLPTKTGHEVGTPSGDDALEWHTTITLKPAADAGPDFAGPAVQGRRGERFFYLSWSSRRDGSCEMFRRMKIHLRGVTLAQARQAAQPGAALLARVHAVARDGGPACASVPLLGGGWSVVVDPVPASAPAPAPKPAANTAAKAARRRP